jgi:hypothetical protein
MENKPTPAWLIALITSLILIVLSLLIYVTDQLTNKYFTYVYNGLILIVIIWACIHYAKQMNGDVTYGNVFAHGFKVTAGIAAIMSIYSFISIKYIHPEIIDKTIEVIRTEMEKNPQLSSEDVDKFTNASRKFFIPGAIGGTLFNNGFVGLIASLLGAAFARKNPVTPFDKPV